MYSVAELLEITSRFWEAWGEEGGEAPLCGERERGARAPSACGDHQAEVGERGIWVAPSSVRRVLAGVRTREGIRASVQYDHLVCRSEELPDPGQRRRVIPIAQTNGSSRGTLHSGPMSFVAEPGSGWTEGRTGTNERTRDWG